MSRSEQIAALFFDAPLLRAVDFRYGKLHVSPDRLEKVGRAIADARVNVLEGEVEPDEEPAAGGYGIRLPADTDPGTLEGRLVILHEGVHALVDTFGRAAGYTLLDHEAVCYVAEALYLRALSRPLPAHGDEGRIFRAADTLARAHRLYWTRGAAIPLRQAHALRNAVHSHSGLVAVLRERQTEPPSRRRCTLAFRATSGAVPTYPEGAAPEADPGPEQES